MAKTTDIEFLKHKKDEILMLNNAGSYIFKISDGEEYKMFAPSYYIETMLVIFYARSRDTKEREDKIDILLDAKNWLEFIINNYNLDRVYLDADSKVRTINEKLCKLI